MTSSTKARQGLTRQMGNMIADTVATMHVPRLVYCVVAAVSTTGPTVSLMFQGTTTVIPGIRYESSYTPNVGDTVYCARVGTDIFVLGKVATISQAWVQVGSAGAPAYNSGWSAYTSAGNYPLAFRRVGDMLQLRG